MNLRDLRARRNLDLRVLSDMRCSTFDFEAYRTITDLEQCRRQVTDREATNVSKYRFVFNILTPVGPGSLSARTEVGIDSDAPDYPYRPPQTWILSERVPWSPFFMAGAPLYIDSGLWSVRGEQNTLGHLALHICHLLNWDQQDLGTGYAGWNAAAIKYHQDAYGGQPINADLSYPVLPTWLGAVAPLHYSFRLRGPSVSLSSHFRS
jgi:hypothetical protein